MSKRPAAAIGIPEKRDSGRGAVNAKASIRCNVLEAIGAERANVFDAFAGAGQMHRLAWTRAASCVGCDEQFYIDPRECFVADNRRVMRAIDLRAFNIFDFDAYGSPWEQVMILLARRPVATGEMLGLVLTEGQGLKMRLGGSSRAFAQLAGIHHYVPGIFHERDSLIDQAIIRLARRMRCGIVKRWEARGRKQSAMRYIGLVLEGSSEKPTS